MALRQAKATPTIEEKRMMTLDFLEASYMHGNKVAIHTVDDYDVSILNAEDYKYNEPVETYIIFDDRPKVQLLKKLGWYREDDEIKPSLAYIPTHLLWETIQDLEIETKQVANEIKLENKDYQELVKHGKHGSLSLEFLKVIRGTLVDIFYDFMPDTINRFYISEVRVDTVSINYVVKLVPYKYDATPQGDADGNTPLLNIKTEDAYL